MVLLYYIFAKNLLHEARWRERMSKNSWRNTICVLSVGLEAVWVYRCLCGFVGYRSW